MKEVAGQASVEVGASPERCLELLRAVERYPQWHGELVREVAVVERGPGGVATVVRATLRVAVGPLAQDVFALLRVDSSESAVNLTRIPHEPGDPEELMVHWEIEPGRLAVELHARLDVPRLLPLGEVGEAIASGLAQAAARALDEGRGSSSNASAISS